MLFRESFVVPVFDAPGEPDPVEAEGDTVSGPVAEDETLPENVTVEPCESGTRFSMPAGTFADGAVPLFIVALGAKNMLV